eukprot:SM000031S11562  [mRNA]  locus=s31:350020:354130:- [translate_table: standard]
MQGAAAPAGFRGGRSSLLAQDAHHGCTCLHGRQRAFACPVPGPRHLAASSSQYHAGLRLDADVLAESHELRRTLKTKVMAAKRGSLRTLINGEEHTDADRRQQEKQAALEAAMSDINRTFGKGSISRLGGDVPTVEKFSSGVLPLDIALDGGLPKGRIVEIYGPESSGKTTLAMVAVAEIQKGGGNAVLLDAEHAFDAAYSARLGVDINNLVLCQPDNGEMGLEIVDKMMRSGAIDLVVVDSVSALTPRSEIEGDIGMIQVGTQARMMSQALRKLSANASKSNCTIIFINQMRYKIAAYGNPETTSGGVALKYYASLRMEIKAIGQKIKGPKDEDIGIRAKVQIKKSKVGRPARILEFDIIFGEGIPRLNCLVDCAESAEVISKKGAWYSYGDTRLGQGREKVLAYLRENPDLADQLEKASIIKEKLASQEAELKLTTVIGRSLSNGSVAGNGSTIFEKVEDEDDDDMFAEDAEELLASENVPH